MYKLLELGIGGRLFNVKENMYSKSSVCIKLDQGLSPEFETNIGIKQGCVISPTLFKLFLNDLPDNLSTNEIDAVELNHKQVKCLMYADDIALISRSKEGLQCCLNKFHDYLRNLLHVSVV